MRKIGKIKNYNSRIKQVLNRRYFKYLVKPLPLNFHFHYFFNLFVTKIFLKSFLHQFNQFHLKQIKYKSEIQCNPETVFMTTPFKSRLNSIPLQLILIKLNKFLLNRLNNIVIYAFFFLPSRKAYIKGQDKYDTYQG